MAKKPRMSAKARQLAKTKKGEVVLFKQRKRTRKAAEGGRETVGFSAQLAAQSRWSIIIDSRTLTRALQIELAEWFRAALDSQINPETGARLPKPVPSTRGKYKKSSGKLGIETGRMRDNWQLGKVTGKVSKARAIVQPYSEGAGGNTTYGRNFFLKYMLGIRSYPPRMVQRRDPKTGRFIKERRETGPTKYPHAPVDFQAVTGLTAAVIEEALDRFINNSGLKTAGPIQDPPKYLGAGSLQKVKSSSGVITGKRGPI